MTSNQRIAPKRKIFIAAGLVGSLAGAGMILGTHDTLVAICGAVLLVSQLLAVITHFYKGRQGHDVDTSR